MYNLICAGSFLIILLLSNALKKTKKNELLLRTTSLILFIYKTLYYIMQNIKGNVSIPVEISSISYFLMTAIFLFRIEKIYNVGSIFRHLGRFGLLFFLYIFRFYRYRRNICKRTPHRLFQSRILTDMRDLSFYEL